MIENIYNNDFMIYIIIKKLDINLSLKNIIYSIKRLYYKKIVWIMRKCF